MKKILLAVSLLLSIQTQAFAQLAGPSTWISQNGSVLKITSRGPGPFRGTFVNQNPQIGCQGIPYPVTGIIASPQVMFRVNFVKCGAIVQWRGDGSGLGMSVQWVMQRGSATTVGFDFFGRR